MIKNIVKLIKIFFAYLVCIIFGHKIYKFCSDSFFIYAVTGKSICLRCEKEIESDKEFINDMKKYFRYMILFDYYGDINARQKQMRKDCLETMEKMKKWNGKKLKRMD